MCVITVVVLVILAFLLTVVVTPANTGYTRFKPTVPITNVAIESDKMTNIPIPIEIQRDTTAQEIKKDDRVITSTDTEQDKIDEYVCGQFIT